MSEASKCLVTVKPLKLFKPFKNFLLNFENKKIILFRMGAVLHGVCHTHSHGPSQSDPDNINVRAAAAHVLGDLLQSVGVLLAAVIIKVPTHTNLFLINLGFGLSYHQTIVATTFCL